MVGTSKVCNSTLSTHRHIHRAEALMHLHFHFLSLVSPKSFAVRNLNGINFWFGRFGIRSMFTLVRSMCVTNGRHNGIKVFKRTIFSLLLLHGHCIYWCVLSPCISAKEYDFFATFFVAVVIAPRENIWWVTRVRPSAERNGMEHPKT